MDDLSGRLLDTLRTTTGVPTLDYAAPPQPLTGGFWAELVSFRLRDAPAELDGDLVARVMPDPALACKETIVQHSVADQGFPTPAVRLSGGADSALGHAFMVMDRVHGAPLLAGLDSLTSLLRIPRLAFRISDTLGTVAARLHRLDPEPVRARLGSETPRTVPELLAMLTDRADTLGRADLARTAQWLTANPPPPAPTVICHGDLHPFNVLIDERGVVNVLDWSAALLAPPAYDVGFTTLMLSQPPVVVPRLAKPVVETAGRWLARAFVRHYERAGGVHVDASAVRWHQGVIALRALVEVANWAAADELRSRTGHPWLVIGPALATRLSALTGDPVAAA
jgi:aminoglycoside phosphotransferase (APT) family kinase protein